MMNDVVIRRIGSLVTHAPKELAVGIREEDIPHKDDRITLHIGDETFSGTVQRTDKVYRKSVNGYMDLEDVTLWMIYDKRPDGEE